MRRSTDCELFPLDCGSYFTNIADMMTNPLKQYREKHKLTLVQAADRFDISNTYLCELENGRPVPLKTARKIAKGTGGEVRVTDLIALGEHETRESKTTAS